MKVLGLVLQLGECGYSNRRPGRRLCHQLGAAGQVNEMFLAKAPSALLGAVSPSISCSIAVFTGSGRRQRYPVIKAGYLRYLSLLKSQPISFTQLACEQGRLITSRSCSCRQLVNNLP